MVEDLAVQNGCNEMSGYYAVTMTTSPCAYTDKQQRNDNHLSLHADRNRLKNLFFVIKC